MIVDIIEEPVASQPWRKKKLHELRCDLSSCENTWRVPYRGNRPDDKLDFCCPEHKYASRRCGEKFDKKLRKLSEERWGVNHHSSLEETKNKISQTKEARWGDKNYNNRPAAARTCQKKFGCDNPSQSDVIKKKIENSMVENWGVTSPIHSPEIRRKIEETNKHRMGVSHNWQCPKLRQRLNSNEVKEKIHQTMKARGRYGKSLVEDKMYDDLCAFYGPENVERQVTLNGWCIDFRVENTYIQLDGVYWHGLDRTVEEITVSKNPRDKIILGTVRRDEAQNAWCQSSGISLIRITDAEYKRQGIGGIIEAIKG